MVTLPRKAKMGDLIHYRLRVVTLDGRQLTGQLLAFDKFMNLVLADTEEFRATKKSLAASAAATNSSNTSDTSSTTTIKEVKRAIGLIILRGETIVSVSVEAPPPSDHNRPLGTTNTTSSTAASGNSTSQQGTARPITRAPLSGPVRTAAPPAFFGGGSSGGAPPPGFHPPPGFGGPR